MRSDAREMFPMIAVRRLLKSWAMPPASNPSCLCSRSMISRKNKDHAGNFVSAIANGGDDLLDQVLVPSRETSVALLGNLTSKE